MRYILIMLFVFPLVAQAGYPDEAKRIQQNRKMELQAKKIRCYQAGQDLNYIRSIMRAGYTAREYNSLREREVLALQKRFDYCR